MISVGIREAKARFSELIDLVLAGEDVVITRRRVPVALLVALSDEDRARIARERREG